MSPRDQTIKQFGMLFSKFGIGILDVMQEWVGLKKQSTVVDVARDVPTQDLSRNPSPTQVDNVAITEEQAVDASEDGDDAIVSDDVQSRVIAASPLIPPSIIVATVDISAPPRDEQIPTARKRTQAESSSGEAASKRKMKRNTSQEASIVSAVKAIATGPRPELEEEIMAITRHHQRPDHGTSSPALLIDPEEQNKDVSAIKTRFSLEANAFNAVDVEISKLSVIRTAHAINLHRLRCWLQEQGQHCSTKALAELVFPEQDQRLAERRLFNMLKLGKRLWQIAHYFRSDLILFTLAIADTLYIQNVAEHQWDALLGKIEECEPSSGFSALHTRLYDQIYRRSN